MSDPARALRNRLAAIEHRLPQIVERLAQLPKNGTSFEAQELISEHGELRAIRQATQRQLAHLAQAQAPAPEPAGDPRRQAIESAIRERRATIETFARKLEAEGDHRQARIWRGQLLDLRARVEDEFAPHH